MFLASYETAVESKKQACLDVSTNDEELSAEAVAAKYCSEDGACNIYVDAINAFDAFPDCSIEDETVKEKYQNTYDIVLKEFKDVCDATAQDKNQVHLWLPFLPDSSRWPFWPCKLNLLRLSPLSAQRLKKFKKAKKG